MKKNLTNPFMSIATATKYFLHHPLSFSISTVIIGPSVLSAAEDTGYIVPLLSGAKHGPRF
jgi:hypothetical protein